MKTTISLFALIICLGCSPNYRSIAIQPLGDVPSEVIDSVSSALSKAYLTDVYVLDKKELPKSTFVNIKSPRYRADSLLRILNKWNPDTIGYIIGITAKDISTTKKDRWGNVKEPETKYRDWGIFGLGQRPGSACIVSTFRLKHSNRNTFFDRLQKVSIHEIGHNKGLHHCPEKGCVMQDAVETIKTVDEVEKELCSQCQRRI